MDNYYLYMNHSYVLLCTECQMPFPPEEFSGQCLEFRMCEDCRRRNPEIVHYLNTYIYEQLLANIRTLFEERLDEIERQLDIIESELDCFRNIYCEDPAEMEFERQVKEYISAMLNECNYILSLLQLIILE